MTTVSPAWTVAEAPGGSSVGPFAGVRASTLHGCSHSIWSMRRQASGLARSMVSSAVTWGMLAIRVLAVTLVPRLMAATIGAASVLALKATSTRNALPTFLAID